MYINGIVIGVFCTLFVEMSVCIGSWFICKVKHNSKKYAATNGTAKKVATIGSGKV